MGKTRNDSTIVHVIAADEITAVLRKRGMDVGTVEFWNSEPWFDGAPFIVRADGGVAVGEGYVVIEAELRGDGLMLRIHVGEVEMLSLWTRDG